MYENKYKNPINTKLEDLDTFLQLIADLDEEIELFAIGGTAMVLKNIKESTKDIDFTCFGSDSLDFILVLISEHMDRHDGLCLCCYLFTDSVRIDC